MTSSLIRKKYIEFFKARGHKEIASAPLVPENDPTTLFTSSGMQPLVPYILGEVHPLGKRLVNSQKCFRSQDIEEVGDSSHTTFFEMLGNWSLGDYFKKEQLPWIFEFFTKEFGLDPKRFYISVFEGSGSVPKDEESIEIWKDLFSGVGIDATIGERIFLYPASKNWWSRSGEPDKMTPGEPGGPDSEIFYDFGQELHLHEHSQYKSKKCHPNCECGRFMEIGNSVFMQYQKLNDGSLKELPQKNVDFGGGLERINAVVNNQPDIFLTDSFDPMIRIIGSCTKKTYGEEINETKAMRVIADHIKAAMFMIGDGVIPDNKQQGYVLRRLIRRAVVKMHQLGSSFSKTELGKRVGSEVKNIYKDIYFQSNNNEEIVIGDEINKFEHVLHTGVKLLEKQKVIDGKIAFNLLQSYGFPWELTYELGLERGQNIDRKEFENEFKKHQNLSRSAGKGMFKGGLADASVETTKLHTATHLLHQALRMVLGNHVSQKGSNITVERLRLDFSHPTKMTPEELKRVEDIVNEQVKKNLAVTVEELDKDEALKSGALGFFVEKYGDRVKVYSAGDFSREICGGPHVSFTGELGHFTIIKEESAASGIRRIYARLH